MAQILKIKYEDTIRRMSVPQSFCYSELEKNVRDFFQVPCTSEIIITYVDTEGDVVTMGNDQELGDACVIQRLNPLKLEVKVVSTQPLQAGSEATIKESTALPFHPMEFDVGGLLKGLFPESTAKAIEQVLSHYPPSLFTTVPAHALPEALDTFLKTLTGYRENSDMRPLAEGGHLEVVPKQAVHKSITCDSCNMFPVVGPRYKSTKKDDYDLCSKCFLEVGNATDYIKLDRPKESKIYSRVPSLSVKPVKSIQKYGLRFMKAPTVSWPSKTPIVEKNGVKDDKHSKRLDAQFVADVTILDGTKIETGTSFTKVWRLKNSGTLLWPQHTELVHTGGNLFGSSCIVKLKLPEAGLPCGSELDVCVDLKAPKRSAHHVGHWRLMAPSGQMFGDKVWVCIEAVPNTHACEVKESLIDEAAAEDADDFFLDTMLESVEVVEDLREEALIDGAALGHASDSALRRLRAIDEACLKKPPVSSPAHLKEPLVDFPTLDGSHGETDCFPLAENELVKECVKNVTFTSADEFELVDSEPASEELEQNDVNTQPLLRSCFEEDDSLTLGGWDYMLNELEEMGFHNTQTNEDSLLKTENSIKQAIRELLELEKQMLGKIKAA